MYAFSRVTSGMFTSPNMRYEFGGWEGAKRNTNAFGQRIAYAVEDDQGNASSTNSKAQGDASARLVDLPKTDESQQWEACSCSNTGPICDRIYGIPEQEQPTAICTDMLPFSLFGKTLVLQFCASSQNTDAEPISSLYRIVFVSNCVCELVTCNTSVRCTYSWYREFSTSGGQLFVSSQSGIPLLLSAEPMKQYRALSINLRAGTQSYGCAYCEAGFANYRLITTDWESAPNPISVQDGSNIGVLNDTVLARLARELQGVPDSGDTGKCPFEVLERIGFNKKFVKQLRLRQAKALGEYNRAELVRLATDAAEQWHLRYLDLHGVKQDMRLQQKIAIV